jgi:hypothetical protein
MVTLQLARAVQARRRLHPAILWVAESIAQGGFRASAIGSQSRAGSIPRGVVLPFFSKPGGICASGR